MADVPALLAEYSLTLNALPPEAVHQAGKSKVWWECGVGHTFERKPVNRWRPDGTLLPCPACALRRRSIAALLPDAVPEFEVERNGTTPDQIAASSQHRVWWRCPANHDFFVSPSARTRLDGSLIPCQVCERLPASLAVRFPELAAEFDSSRNQTTPDLVAGRSMEPCWWLCAGGHSFQASPWHRTGNDGSVKRCRECRLSRSSVAAVSSLLATEFRAGKNKTGPDRVFAHSDKPFRWRCSAGHSWEASPTSRWVQGTARSCPTCYLSKNSIESLCPKLVPEYDQARNPLPPSEVLMYSTLPVWWSCSNGHAWEAPPLRRVSQPGAARTAIPCQECRREGRTLEAGFPDIAREYDAALNSTPLVEVLSTSLDYAVWRCANNSSHTWSARVKTRTQGGGACPSCLPWGRSRTEVLVMFEVATVVPLDLSDSLVEGASRHWRCDGVLREDKVVVEYDGTYFHSFPGCLERDRRKTVDLEAKGWRVVRIRSPLLGVVNERDVVVDPSEAPASVAALVIERLQGMGVPVLYPYVPGSGAAAALEYLAAAGLQSDPAESEDKPVLPNLQCKQCRAVLVDRRRRYCNDYCSDLYATGGVPRSSRSCGVCSADLPPRRQSYCGPECAKEAQTQRSRAFYAKRTARTPAVCAWCENGFEAKAGQDTCSTSCRRKHADPEAVRVRCKHCAKVVTRGGSAMYCNQACYSAHHHTLVLCEQCPKRVLVPNSQAASRRFCSPECHAAHQRGETPVRATSLQGAGATETSPKLG